MRGKKLLAAFLLGVGLCFVPALGQGEVKQWMIEKKVRYTDFLLLKASVKYMMWNPTNFLCVTFTYTPDGVRVDLPGGLPEGVVIRGKIWVRVADNRGVFSSKSTIALREAFKKILDNVYPYIDDIATDMDTDIVAIFANKEIIPLGYFYQGEYHLWRE